MAADYLDGSSWTTTAPSTTEGERNMLTLATLAILVGKVMAGSTFPHTAALEESLDLAQRVLTRTRMM